jgi:hypothetical protein
MALQSNQQGFLVGERIVNGIDLVHKDTSQILELMTQGYQRSKRNAFIARNVPNQMAANDIGQVSNTNAQAMQKLPKQIAQLKENQAISSAIATNDIGASVVRAKMLRQAQEPAILERDAKGRFVSGKQETDEVKDAKIKSEDEQDKKDSVLKKIFTTLAGKIHAPDSEHIDPTIDALKEVGAFKAIGLVAGAGSWLLSLRGKKDDKKEGKDEDKKNSFSFLGSIFGGIISKAILAAIAVVAIKKTGDVVNEAIQGTDTGRAATDAIGSGVDHVAAAMGDTDAQDRLDQNKKLGSLSNKFEGKLGSANKDNKGYAYGKYQFNSATGGLDKFFKDNPQYAAQFNGIKAGTPEFANKWKEIASTDSDGFNAAQDKSGNAMYEPNNKLAKTLGFKTDNRGIQEAIFSGSINHGKFSKILKDASDVKGFADMDAEQQTKTLYDSRRKYVQGLTDLTPKVKKSLSDRYDKEEPLAISLATAIPKPANVMDDLSSTDSKQSLPPTMNIGDAKTQAGMSAPQVPPSPAVGAVPAMPTTQKQLNTPMPAPQTIPASNDSISQNLSDRDLAHAVTGGLGMSRWMG